MPWPPEQLAAHLDAGLTNGIQVYATPPDSLTPPAVVVIPADPYIAPYTQGGPAAVVWGLELGLVVSRRNPQAALQALWRLRLEVCQQLATAPLNARWLAFESPDPLKVGDSEYLQGKLTVALIADDVSGD